VELLAIGAISNLVTFQKKAKKAYLNNNRAY